MEVNGRCYTLDVNPTSGNRVKVRLYETRAVREGGNILLLQGQLSVKQFQALEELLFEGAKLDATEFVRVGRYYALQATAAAIGGGSSAHSPSGAARQRSRATVGSGGSVADRGVGGVDSETDPRPRAPWISGPVIGPHGPVNEDEADDDYGSLAHIHVARMLRRLRTSA